MSQRTTAAFRCARETADEQALNTTSSARVPDHPILRLQQAVGNRTIARLFEADPDATRGTEEASIANGSLGSIINGALGSSSRSLDADTRAFMESRFAYDFSDVRLHTDEEAAESAAAVNAEAYTVGSDIVFGEGAYSPGSSEGRRLIAHELTHIVQQDAGPVGGTSSPDGSVSISDPADESERAAEATADHVMSSETLSPTGARSLGLGAAEGGASTQGVGIQRQSDGSGTITIPEVTVTGAADPAAYNQGYAEGQKCGDHPVPRLSGASMDSWNQGFSDAQSEISCPYTGPSIGPAPSDEELEKDKKAAEDAEEQRREFLRELGQEIPEDEKPGPEEPEPEVPEIVGD